MLCLFVQGAGQMLLHSGMLNQLGDHAADALIEASVLGASVGRAPGKAHLVVPIGQAGASPVADLSELLDGRLAEGVLERIQCWRHVVLLSDF